MRQLTKAEFNDANLNGLSWQANDVLRAKWSARLAWTVAGVAGLLAVAGVAAVAMLAPLKKVTPYVIQVDKSTGQTNILTAMTDAKSVTYDESLKRFFIATYVKDREGWVPLAENEINHAVRLLSSEDERKRWDQYFSIVNPMSPQKQFEVSPMVNIEIKSISFVNEHVAQVRYQRTIFSHSAAPVVSNWNAVVTFDITNKPTLEADLNINPIGFQVGTYQTNPEV